MSAHANGGTKPVVEPALFREGMSHVVSAVHVITTGGPAGRAGFTATAVSSVSDAPATLLVCMNAGSSSAAHLAQNGLFAVNTLASTQQAVAEAFSGRTGLSGEARFDAGAWTMDDDGLPVLGGAVAVFRCRLTDVHRVATHLVLFGEVYAVTPGRDEHGLAYLRRHFVQV
jgi:flavin reductase (DIM6/NTAB) family NADH-FMN oxidoreductase RutF